MDYSSSPYYGSALAAADQYGVPQNIFTALIGSESSFNPNAVSPTGVRGIAQFTGGTARQYGVNPTDPQSSLTGAAHYLSDLYKRLGSWSAAVLSYKGASDPINVSLYGGPSKALNSDLKTALANPSSVDGSAAGGASGSSTTPGSETSPNSAASSNTSGCTGWISTPVACITATLTELGLIVLGLIVLAIGVHMLSDRG